ncbi:MAG: hypothetical protein RIT01_159 [Pseudomonadota bacterium]|jgi:Mn-dependent DtxR family transcriptional regulator
MENIVYSHTSISPAVKSGPKPLCTSVHAPEGFRHLRINPQVIKVISDEGDLRLLAVFLRLKSEFKNSCIYNSTDSKLAGILKVSRQTAGRMRKQLELKGWVRYHNNNLMLLKVSEISRDYVCHKPEKFSKRANVYLECKNKQVKELETYLRYLIIKHKEVTKNFAMELSHDLHKPKTVKEYKKLLSLSKKYSIEASEGENDYRLQISYKGIAKLLKCSVGSAYNFVRNIARKSFLHVHSKKEVLLSNIPEHIWKDYLSYQKVYKNCIYSYGYIIKIYCNKYTLLV